MATSPLTAANLFNLTGMIAVITEGTTGLGFMIAQALTENGAKVYVTSKDAYRPDDTRDQLQNRPDGIVQIHCDVTSKVDLERSVAIIAQEDGYINLLIHCHGISTTNMPPKAQRPKPGTSIKKLREFWFEEREPWDAQKLFEANTTGVLFATAAFLELLDQGNKMATADAKVKGRMRVRSQVIAMTSFGAFHRTNDAFVYNASKAATNHMMQNLATYLIPWNIRCNVIAPGWFECHEHVVDAFKKSNGVLPKTFVPEERVGTRAEIGGTVLWMASEAGAYCNGNITLIDGGVCSL